MRKFALGIALVLLLAIGAIAYAHGPGGWGGGHMMGPGYGDWPCPMMGGSGYGYDQKFLDETAELRKQLHNKRFEYSEAYRDTKTAPETLTGLEKEILELEEKISEKAPRRPYRGFRGYGPWW